MRIELESHEGAAILALIEDYRESVKDIRTTSMVYLANKAIAGVLEAIYDKVEWADIHADQVQSGYMPEPEPEPEPKSATGYTTVTLPSGSEIESIVSTQQAKITQSKAKDRVGVDGRPKYCIICGKDSYARGLCGFHYSRQQYEKKRTKAKDRKRSPQVFDSLYGSIVAALADGASCEEVARELDLPVMKVRTAKGDYRDYIKAFAALPVGDARYNYLQKHFGMGVGK